jgi:hypothetical protein
MRTEDDIREAFRELARGAPDVDSILAGLPERPGGRARGGRRRARRLLAPVAASAAVVAVIAASIAIASGGHIGGGVSRSTIAPGAEAFGRGVPSYYMAITQAGTRQVVTTVRDTRSGAVLATVNPPEGYQFNYAEAGANDDSFLLTAQRVLRSPALNEPESFYVVQFNPAALSTKLVRLPIPAIANISGFTISPGGTELAVAIADPQGSQIRIYALAGQLIRHWQDPGYACYNGYTGPCPSWGASGYLAFTWTNGSPAAPGFGHSAKWITGPSANGIRMIRVTAASGSLVYTSHLVVPFPDNSCISFILSGNTKTIAASVQLAVRRGRTWYPFVAFEEFSAATGKLTGQYWRTRTLVNEQVYWSNQTGSTLIVMAPLSRTSQKTQWRLGILTRGRFMRLPTPGALGLLVLAF